MQVSTGMSSMVVTVSPGLTLHDAARAMSERKVGAAVVLDPEQPGPGIITERDVLQSVGSGQDPNTELVRDHLSPKITFAAPDWSLERAALKAAIAALSARTAAPAAPSNAPARRGSFGHVLAQRA